MQAQDSRPITTRPGQVRRPISDSASRRWAGALVAAGLWAVAGMAQASTNIDITSSDVSATPGSTALAVFDFDFGAGVGITSFSLNLSFDKTLVELDPLHTAVSYHGAAIDPAAVFGADFNVNASDPAGLSALWLPLAVPQPVASFDGAASLTLAYKLLAPLTAGTSTAVTLDFGYSDANGDDGLVNSLASSPVTSTINVSAVPEPQTWALALTGLAVIGWLGRRRPSMRGV